MAGTAIDARLIGGMAVKAVGWSFFTGALGAAVISLLANQNLITKIAFPREVLPIAAVLASCLDALIGAGAIVVLIPILGIWPTASFFWVVPLVVLLVLLTAAISTILAAANLFFRDVKYIVQIALTFGVFFTPVIYEPAMLGPMGARLAMLNPIAPVLEGLRLALIEGHNLIAPLVIVSAKGQSIIAWHPLDLVYSSVVAILGSVGALLLYRRLTYVFAEYV
jgi:ABC-type polysaccharide/polyol phosphate export permease